MKLSAYLRMNEIYKEHILEHYRNPQNKGVLSDATFVHKEFNPFCGDELTMHVKLDNQMRTEKLAFEGRGCAISLAAASLFTEELCGKSFEQVRSISKTDIEVMLGIPLSTVRIQCAMLPVRAVVSGWKKYLL